jgi:hypothetical protein
MPITLTISADSAEDFKTQFAELAAMGFAVGYKIEGAPPAAENKPTRIKTVEETLKALKVDETKAPLETPKLGDPDPKIEPKSNEPKAEAPTDGAIDYDTVVKPAVLRVSAKFGRAGVEDLLKPFDVTNAKQVPPERYADLLKAVDAKLAEAN